MLWLHELHYGEVVVSARPKAKHFKLQTRLAHLLRPKAAHLGVVEIEVPFRAVPQFDLRAADVAFISRERWASLCLANGCQDFWIIDEKARTITVIGRDGKAFKYSGADSVPLPLFGGDGLRVADVFK